MSKPGAGKIDIGLVRGVEELTVKVDLAAGTAGEPAADGPKGPATKSN